jgi:uncharacterized 2Fe-2S/4Fe-4S cluster protein (DUF4445 family)
MNPQRSFGADVISRIQAANEGKLEALRAAIAERLSGEIRSLLKARKVPAASLTDLVIAGNTTMIHLLLGLPCHNLGVAPFHIAHTLRALYPACALLGPDAPDCRVRIVPWLAAFIGGDIAAGLLHALGGPSERFLLMDLGTNGELALYDRGELTITATAAGPAFEGSASGRTASEVLDEAWALLKNEWMDETGRLAEGAPGDFTQKEIRELQLAKSAVRTGVDILLESADMPHEALDAIYLAGGIGQALKASSAIGLGLLPAALGEKISAAGNASLGGAARLLLCPERAADVEALGEKAVEVHLNLHPGFNDLFAENMFFE